MADSFLHLHFNITGSPFANFNATDAPFVSWIPEPGGRSTWSILTTCFSTLTVGAYSAVHIDIPTQERSRIRRFFITVGWVIVGVISPVQLMVLALYQFYIAICIVRLAQQIPGVDTPDTWFYRHVVNHKVNPHVRSKWPASHPRTHCTWTLRHGFWVAMGGLVLDTAQDEGENHEIYPDTKRFVVTPKGFKYLVTFAPHLIPVISEAEIQDRSKIDSLGKALFVWQSFYFIVSSIARISQSLPLTLLEISTLAHSICTITTCILWWRKPANVDLPTPIYDQEAEGIAALLLMKSCTTRYFHAGVLHFHARPECDFLVLSLSTPGQPMPDNHGGDVQLMTNTAYSIDGQVSIEIRPPNVERGSDPSIVYYGRTTPWYARKALQRQHNFPDKVVVTSTDVRRWTRAARYLADYRLSNHDDVSKGHPFPYVSIREGLQSALHWTHLDAIKHGSGVVLCILLISLISTVYGVIHLLGWNTTFATDHERRLWRIASVILSTYSLIAMVVFIINRHSSKEHIYRKANLKTRAMLLAWNVAWPGLHLFCGLYLLMQSIRQLFYLPPGAYESPSWSKYWPHFS